MIAFFILLAALFAVVVGNELLSRATHAPLEVSRKVTHILTGVLVAAGAWFVPRPYLIVLGLAFIAVILVSRRRGIFRSIHDPERAGIGELWYPVGILLSALLFGPAATFAYAVLILSVSDGLAGLIGRQFGRRRIAFISAPKTYLGTAAFIVSAFAISYFFLPLPTATGASVLLAAIELLSFAGLDNLILPLAAGVIATVLPA